MRKADLARGRIDGANDAARRRGLAAAAFADQRQRLARRRCGSSRRRRRAHARRRAGGSPCWIGKCFLRLRPRAAASAPAIAAVMRRLPRRRGSSCTVWPSPTATWRRHRRRSQMPGMNDGQRGWNGHPVGRLLRMRHAAGDGRELLARRPRRRSESIAAAPLCRGALASWKIASTGALSTTSPRYITTTSSAISAIDAEVVGDEHDRHAVALLQLAQKVEDLRLRRHVERGGRLVGDQQARVARQARWRSSRAGAGRRSAGRSRRRCAARDSGCRPGASASMPIRRASFARHVAMQADRLDELAADGVDRAERRHRLLEDKRDLVAADGAHRLAVGIERGKIDHSPEPPCRRPRRNRISPPTIWPGRSRMPRIERAVTDLPQPLSPTMPSVLPGRTSKLTPSTAIDCAFVEHEMGLEVADGEQRRGVDHRGAATASRDRRRRAARRRGS